MIPTSDKSKLPKTLSYPLGAGAISEALADAPHVEDFTLSFSDMPVWPGAEFRRVLRDSLPYKLIEAEFRSATRAGYSGCFSEQWYDRKWTLCVYPVLRALRRTSRQILLEQGMPALVEWLRSSGQTGWDLRQHKFALVFNPVERILTTRFEDGI